MDTLIARWETRGNDWLELYRGATPGDYYYRGNSCGGGVVASNDAEAVAAMEAPWGSRVGQATVLKTDRPSLKRIFPV
jgi:hypothetical protein